MNKYLVKIDYTGFKDPIKSPHGLGLLLNYAKNLDLIMGDVNAKMLTSVIWECHEPVGYAVFEAENESILMPLTEKFGPHTEVSIKQVRFLEELIELGNTILPELIGKK